MFRFLSDENLDGPIVNAIRGAFPNLDMVRVVDVGLAGVADPDLLEWAAVNGRIVLSHDRKTMRGFASARVAAGLAMPGLFVLARRIRPGVAVAELRVILGGSQPDEWVDRVESIPL